MTQKVLKVGTSAAVTIPKKFLKAMGLKTGDRVDLEMDQGRKTVKIKPTVRIENELLEWTESFIEKYRPALEELAKR